MREHYSVTRKHWNGIEIEIRWNPDYLVYDDHSNMAHLEVESVSPAKAPLPITETGYKSHFTPIAALDGYTDLSDFVEDWLASEVGKAAWREAEAARRQLSLL